MINLTLPNTSGFCDVDRETVSLKGGSSTSTLEQLGFCLVGNRSRGVFIKSIYPGSPAAKSGRIHIDDKLVQADDVPLLGLTPSQVVRILNSALSHNPTIQLTILHCGHPSNRFLAAAAGISENLAEQNAEKLAERGKSNNSNNNDDSNAVVAVDNAMKPQDISAQAEVHRSEAREDEPQELVEIVSAQAEAHLVGEAVKNEKESEAVNETSSQNDDRPSSSLPRETVSAFKGRRVTFVNMSMDTSSGESTGDLCSVSEDDFSPSSRNGIEKVKSDRFSANYEKEHVFWALIRRFFQVLKGLIIHDPSKFEVTLSRGRRRIFNRDNIDKIPNDELPLISFDQLSYNHQSVSPGDKKRFQSADRQSKSSKESDGSQNLFWYCPVCLDGASRISRTQRRLMSTVCGHVFCSRCIEDAIAKQGRCPSCRTKLKSLTEVHPIFM